MSDGTIPDLEAPESILRRISTLIEQAQHYRRHGEEGSAEAAYHLADKIAAKYAIDLAQVDSKRTKEEREKPISTNIDFPYSAWDSYLARMLRSICNLAKVRIRRKGHYNNFIIVGFQSDVDYVQMLWMNTHLTFMAKIDPRWDTAKTADENIKALKESGIKWADIADYANMHGFECKPNDGKLKAAYRRQCKKEGVEPTSHTQRHGAYRESFAAFFVEKIEDRLLKMGLQREEMSSSSGAELVLFDRFAAVNAMFFEMFPEMHPDAIRARQDAALQLSLEADREEEERRAKLTPKQREAEDRKREREQQRYDREDQLRYHRMYDRNGAAAGRKAGNSVDLSAGRNGVRQSNSKQIGK
jgi:hypothetical protein